MLPRVNTRYLGLGGRQRVSARSNKDYEDKNHNPVIDEIAVNLERTIEDNTHRWFALRVKCRYEKLVSTLLRDKGYEEFLPLYWSRRRWSDRFQSVDLPLFPGYVFCRLDPQQSRLPLLITPGAMHFVGIGRSPEPIDDSEIAAIQSALRSGLSAQPWPFLKVGHRVRLEEGPLNGIEGILIEVRKKHRIVVSVTLLQRSIAVEIERQWIRPLDSARPSISVSRPSALAVGSPCT